MKIVDFGSATIIQEGKKAGIEGSPGYIAPELLITQGKAPLTIKIDCFSLGVLLYKMIHGYTPFTGHSQTKVLLSNRIDEIDFEKEPMGDVSDSEKTILQGLISKDPRNRKTAKEALLMYAN